MIYRHTQEDVNRYYDYPALNQSSIKVIIKEGMQEFLNKGGLSNENNNEDDLYYEEKEHFLIGSGVDDWLTMGEGYYSTRYHVSTLLRKPGATTMSVLRMVFDEVKENLNKGVIKQIEDPENYKALIQKACNIEEFYLKRHKDDVEKDSRINTILSDNSKEYWKDLMEAGDKQILTEKQSSLANYIIRLFLDHRFTAKYFKDGEDITIIYQMPLYFNHSDVACKVLPDGIYIDHKARIIILFDVKTTGFHVTRFNYQIELRRYDLQASFYLTGVRANKDAISNLISRDISSYLIHDSNFMFLVESTKSPGTPLVYNLSSNLVRVGQWGNNAPVTGKRRLLGWQQGLDTYRNWREREFTLENMITDYNGVVTIRDDFEHTNSYF